MGGGTFSRGQICKILSNPIFLGEIHHRGNLYEGKVHYRYHVSRALQHEPETEASKGIRIPALVLEKAVREGIAKLFDNPLGLIMREYTDAEMHAPTPNDFPYKISVSPLLPATAPDR